MSQVYLGSIILFAGNFAPRGFALCSGQIMNVNSNTALFSILGTTYGGNGSTTFALPDLRGRAPISQGVGPGLPPYVLGQLGGLPNVTLLPTNLPAHAHPYAPQVSNAAADQSDPTNGIPAVPATSAPVRGQPAPTPTFAYTQGAATGSSAPQMTGIAGGSQPVAVQSPYLALNYCIAIQGLYPSRN